MVGLQATDLGHLSTMPGTLGGIRTHTAPVLRRSPLPIGLPELELPPRIGLGLALYEGAVNSTRPWELVGA